MKTLRIIFVLLMILLAVPSITVANWHTETVDSTGDVGEYTFDAHLVHGKFFGAYRAGDHVLSFTLHNDPDFNDNKGAIEVRWSYTLTRNLKAYLQGYNGYGASLIDYNNFTNRIGIGLMINDWL